MIQSRHLSGTLVLQRDNKPSPGDANDFIVGQILHRHSSVERICPYIFHCLEESCHALGSFLSRRAALLAAALGQPCQTTVTSKATYSSDRVPSGLKVEACPASLMVLQRAADRAHLVLNSSLSVPVITAHLLSLRENICFFSSVQFFFASPVSRV